MQRKDEEVEEVRRRILLAGVVWLLLLAWTSTLWAQAPPSYHVQKEIQLYGNLKQGDIPVWGGVACGPTAAINSFVYLQNKYPSVYDSNLIGDADNDGIPNTYQDLIAVANILGGAQYMNTIAMNTTWHDDFIWGKQAYIEAFCPNVTTYAAQDIWNWNNPARPRPAWVQPVYPTWDFLYNELLKCQDVEILLTWGDNGHYLTLTSFHWTDLDWDGVIDQNENASIDYIDPCTGAWGQTAIWHAAVGPNLWKIETGYNSSYISMAVKESPVPEPASLLVLCSGLAGLMGVLKRYKRV